MIEKLKKIGIVVTIAILFTVFVFAMTSAVYPRPEYNEFCNEPVDIQKPIDKEKCGDVMPQAIGCNGPVDYEYDTEGCPVRAKCNECFEGFESAMKNYNLILFIVSSIVGVGAILFGLFYKKQDDFWNLAKGGFLLGGLISLFSGTSVYYQDMGRFFRPLIIIIELIIILLVTYKIIKRKK